MILNILTFSTLFAILPITFGIPKIYNDLNGPHDIAQWEPHSCPGLSWCFDKKEGKKVECPKREEWYSGELPLICCCGIDNGAQSCCWDNCPNPFTLEGDDASNCTEEVGIPEDTEWVLKDPNNSKGPYHLVKGKLVRTYGSIPNSKLIFNSLQIFSFVLKTNLVIVKTNSISH